PQSAFEGACRQDALVIAGVPRTRDDRKSARTGSHFRVECPIRATAPTGTMMASSIDHAFMAESPLGRSGDPTYAGALSFMRRKYTKNVAGADAVVWGIPFD